MHIITSQDILCVKLVTRKREERELVFDFCKTQFTVSMQVDLEDRVLDIFKNILNIKYKLNNKENYSIARKIFRELEYIDFAYLIKLVR